MLKSWNRLYLTTRLRLLHLPAAGGSKKALSVALFLWENEEEEFVQLLFLSSALCFSHSVYSSIFFLENTTVPNLREVKENMTMGTTLVTNPNGGFLVSGGSLYSIWKCSAVHFPYQTNNMTELCISAKTGQQMITRPLDMFPTEASCPEKVRGYCKSTIAVYVTG